MASRYSRVIYLGCVCVLLCLSAFAKAGSKPAFWRVSSDKATVYLMGSMHFGAEEFYPLPDEIEQAYRQSDLLAVEVDISQITPAMVATALQQHGRLPGGQTLSQSLSADLYKALTAKVEQANMPMSALEPFQPWFVAMQLVEAEIRKTQLKQSLGIDLHFISKALKPVHELEGLERQFALFGNLSVKEQEKFLMQTLADMDSSRTYLDAMADAWRRGDVKQLELTLIDSFKENPETRKLFQTMFTERNNMMTAAVTQFLAEGKNVFFVVGVGHMLGEQGIVEQLTKQGISVGRIVYTDQRATISGSAP